MNQIDLSKKWESLTLADDFVFCKVMTNEDVCKTLLEQMLNIKIDHLEYIQSQQTIDLSLGAKGVRFDVYVKDSDKVFDIEMQKINKSDLPRRARYYQSMIDIENTYRGDFYNSVKESYVIFICMFDPFNQNKSCYHFQNICIDDSNLKLDDKTHKIFYNACSYSNEINPEIKAFLEYLSKGNIETDLTKKLQDLVNEALHNEKWRLSYMTFEMKLQEEREVGIKEGIQQGGRLKAIETAKNMKKANIDINTISECTGLSIEEIEKI